MQPSIGGGSLNFKERPNKVGSGNVGIKVDKMTEGVRAYPKAAIERHGGITNTPRMHN
jgi:hypothetical protein